MYDKTEHSRDAQPELTTMEVQNAAPGRQSRNNARTVIVIATAVVALVAIAAVAALLLANRNKSGAGRPVPAPGSVAVEQAIPTTQPQTEPTVTLSLQAAQNAAIKLETVGEQLTTNAATTSAVSTGAVQANTYRTTPVVALVGGILRRVNAELGQNVRQGQTMAV